MALSFLKTGAESAKLAQKAAAEAAAAKATQGKLWRFWIKDGGEARITFVDGDLNAEGFLCPPRYYEHNLFLNGSWNNPFVCPVKTNPETKDVCPICESGDKPALVALFTIIDHRQYEGKDKKVYKDSKRLLVAKSLTFDLLNKIAMKEGGLTGCTFDVSRTGDKAASVGSLFYPVGKASIEELKAMYMEERVDPKTNAKTKVTKFTPADYEKEIVYHTGAQLIALGFGKDSTPTIPASAQAPELPDYSQQL